MARTVVTVNAPVVSPERSKDSRVAPALPATWRTKASSAKVATTCSTVAGTVVEAVTAMGLLGRGGCVLPW